MQIQTRKMEKQDLAQLATIEALSFPSPWSPKALAEHLSNSRTTIGRVAICDAVIGYSISWKAADELNLEKIAVHPDFRRQGIAKFLMNDLLSVAHEFGCRIVWLEVRHFNKAAINLYRCFGFEEKTLRKKYYSNGNDAVVMCKILDKTS